MADQQIVVRTAKGIFSQFNRMECPPGALLQADNCVIDRPGILEKRRGFNRDITLSTSGATLFKFNKTLLILDGSTLKRRTGAGATSSYSGTYAAPTGCRMEGAEAQQSFYFTTSNGVYKIDSLTGTPQATGVPPGLDVQLAETGVTGFFAADSQVGYRICFIRNDSNGQEFISEPSFQEVLVNVAGGTACNVTVTLTIPTGLTTSDYYEVYRTEVSATDDTAPGDRHRLVERVKISTADITNGYATFSDDYADTELGEDLYTNPLKETIGKGNNRPPYAEHIAMWNGHLWFANTRQPHYAEIQLLTVLGITDDTTAITITDGTNSHTYTFAAAEDFANHKFQRHTAYGTAAENRRYTMKSFCRAVNRDNDVVTPNTTFWAQYTSGETGNPGIVKIFRRDLDDTSFTVSVSTTDGVFQPDIYDAALTSQDDAAVNRLYRSKYEKCEAVPTTNYDVVGSANYEILGLCASKDALYVLKEDGYWIVTGATDGSSGASFTIAPHDPTLKLIAPGTVCSLDNATFAHTSQGIIRTTESGSKIMSWPIEIDILRIAQSGSYSTLGHAIAYESERKYLLCTPERIGDTKVEVIWVYNYVTEAWTRWRMSVSSGIVVETSGGGDLLYLALSDQPYVLQERKTLLGSDDDYSDETLDCTVTAFGTTTDEDGDTVTTVTATYTDTDVDLTPGMLFEQGDYEGIVKSFTLSGTTTYTFTLDRQITVAVGAATVTMPIKMEVVWMPEAAGTAATMKQWSEGQIYFERDGGTHTMGFCADTQVAPSMSTEIVIPKSYGWGQSAWGSSAWGDSYISPSSPIRSWAPRNHQRSRAMRLMYTNEMAKEKVSILQVTYGARQYSDRTTRNP